MFGGVSILSLLISDPNDRRTRCSRICGAPHAGVWLMPVLVALRHVGKANLSSYMKWFVRASIPNRCRPGSGGLLPLSGVTRCHRPEWAHLSCLRRGSVAGCR
jgi:hypothetical protein